jgi:hypothetical protein
MTRKSTTRRSPAKRPAPDADADASRQIDERIEALNDWRGETLSRMRALILEADPAIVEECKWRGTPTWSRDGIVCTGETYAKVVKLTFAHGARLADPSKLFNASLDGNTRRAIDIREGETVDAAAFRKLVKAAVARNRTKAKVAKPARATPTAADAGPKLLSGGNPQIAKGDGDAPVQAYIAAMPGWKHDIGRQLDTLIDRTIPDVRKAIRWNSPFYGIEGQGWFVSVHCLTKCVRITFFRGTSLRPAPPVSFKAEGVRSVDVSEGAFDEAQMESWVRQAAALPGWIP